ncbi:Ku protein [Microvirga brassicacearum]|uniref:Non-homologous end joining protein Ku n=1 Tax=Microvirga brassicacearum TaxID=2580413 RepID=A0A5N3P8U0_9HYPH|nr:Ku protein [Microvirga brassicacearum]KAB0266152.1 Ku protein [Microvirga brassicacearum]
MAPRANWKGFLKVGELSCPVALYTAASSSDRIAFHTLNRESGHRVKRQFVDPETGDAVPADQQVKGYEIAKGEYVVLEPEEVAAAIPESDKTLDVEAFVDCREIDDIYFDRPYYLTPSSPAAQEAFALIREGMRAKQVAALARAVLFRRVRTLLVRVHGDGLIATTLNFDYEIRSSQDAFEEIPDRKIEGEMLDLANHIITTKRGTFDPSKFEDRYESALSDLVKAKMEGKPFAPRKAPAAGNVVNLLDALRKSAGVEAKSGQKAGSKTTARGGRKPASAKGKSATAAKKAAAKRGAASATQRRKAS